MDGSFVCDVNGGASDALQVARGAAPPWGDASLNRSADNPAKSLEVNEFFRKALMNEVHTKPLLRSTCLMVIE